MSIKNGKLSALFCWPRLAVFTFCRDFTSENNSHSRAIFPLSFALSVLFLRQRKSVASILIFHKTFLVKLNVACLGGTSTLLLA